jgi:ABC-type sugar transport system substrate-binding protein
MNNIKKIMVGVLSGLMLMSSLTAQGTQETGKEKQMVIGYSVQSMENDYFVSVVNGMKEEAQKKNVKLIVCDAASDAAKHIDHIENFINQGIDGIIISPVDEEVPVNAVAEAIAAGIPVVAANQPVKGASAFYGIDEHTYGYTGGGIAGKWLNEKEADGTIESLLDEDGCIDVCVIRQDFVTSCIPRGDGLKDGLEDTYTGKHPIKYVLESSGNDAAKGMKIAEAALTSNPATCIVLAINDSTALGAYEVFMADSSKNADNVCITGLDALPEALEKIAGNTMYKGTVDIQPKQEGADMLDICLDVIANGPIAEKIEMSMKAVDKDDISDYIK